MGGVGIESRARAIPIIDMASMDQQALDDALWEAASECGFFQLSGHAFSAAELNAAFAAAEDFFALPDGVKARYPLLPNTNAGWESKSQVRPSTGTPDQKESFQITRPRMQGLWPSAALLPGFTDTLLGFERKAWRLAMRVLASFARKLGFADDFFAKAHDHRKRDYQCTLRLLHYFPVPAASGAQPARSGEALWRAGAHTDFDCLTLLFQRDGEGGLQVCPGREADSGAWTPVPPRAELITCNIGDMLMRWSDDALRSTLHRVRMPESGSRRLSMAFFAQANGRQWIRGPKGKHAPISAENYLRQRIAANFDALPSAGHER